MEGRKEVKDEQDLFCHFDVFLCVFHVHSIAYQQRVVRPSVSAASSHCEH